MKKRFWIPVLAVLLLAVLIVPLPSGPYRDGGTQAYTALTYKVVNWNRIWDNATYSENKIYYFPDNFKSIDRLWEEEKANMHYSFDAVVLELNDTTALVEWVNGDRIISGEISFNIENLEKIDVTAGSVVHITYTGLVMETYPAQIHATSWQLSDDPRYTEYTGQWLDRDTAEAPEGQELLVLEITAVYNNCFFARSIDDSTYEIKVNYRFLGGLCIGDTVTCRYSAAYYDPQAQRMEIDATRVSTGYTFDDGIAAAKPVIYLYPQQETTVSVRLNLDGELTCAYPAYKDGWQVTAAPDGTLTDTRGQTYNYLYWESQTNAQFDLSKGFCVKGKDTAAFLEKALAQLGLTRREANEFIVYWLPLMQDNPYNIIAFQTDIYTEAAQLDITPTPDTLIRVFMTWQKSDTPMQLPAQELSAPARTGFTVIEWGGSQLPD